ncbi:MAG: fibronectin type III domain-containing protein, partial [Bacteroidota bacterium]
RFGGGNSSVSDCSVSFLANKPRFEEGAELYARFMGYPNCDGDVTIRPRYAEWELAKGAASEQNNLSTGDINSVYVSWHTNAGGGTGTSSFIWDPATFISDPSPFPTGCSGAPGGVASARLRNFIHDEVIQDIRAEYDPAWTDRGKRCANFGELRSLSTMPGALFEMGFHDTPSDAVAITTPDYRKIVARAVYQGLVQFYNYYDNSVPVAYAPEPPSHLYARNTGANQITLSWNAPSSTSAGGDAATGYQLYMSTHGKGFADGIPVTGTSYTVTGLQPSTTYYFRVASTNIGGESFPTTVVAVRTPDVGAANPTPFLIVDGFDRLERSQMIRASSTGLGTLYRGFLDKMNSFTYMVEHAKAMESCCNQAFDGASNEAVIDGIVNLNSYELIDWMCGEESTNRNTLDATERSLVQNFLDNGGNLIISGAEIGWDIGRTASPNADLPFYNNYLKATYAGDDGGTYNFVGVAGDIYAGLGSGFDDGSADTYDVNFPDRLTPFGGAMAVLNYSGGTGDGAAIAYKGTDFGVVNFGFPLETVTDEATRQQLICNALDFLVVDDGVVACNSTSIRAKVFLQGPLSGTSMIDNLNTANLIALNQPYNIAPYNYTGTESVATIPPNVVDWV